MNVSPVLLVSFVFVFTNVPVDRCCILVNMRKREMKTWRDGAIETSLSLIFMYVCSDELRSLMVPVMSESNLNV